MQRAEAFKKIQASCDYNFKNINLLNEALTHDSNKVNDRAMPTYQRLEFLGDSALNLIVTEHLFRKHPEFNEGQLTDKRKELTEAAYQRKIAEKLNLKEHVLLGQSVNKDVFSKYHSFVESLIGAIYIDGGLDEARKVIYRIWELTDNPNASTWCTIS